MLELLDGKRSSTLLGWGKGAERLLPCTIKNNNTTHI
jgi:hypothetical protein